VSVGICKGRLLTSDIDDDGYDANGEFLRYFFEHCDGNSGDFRVGRCNMLRDEAVACL